MGYLRTLLACILLIILFQNFTEPKSATNEDLGLFGDFTVKWSPTTYKKYFGRSALQISFDKNGAPKGELHFAYEPPANQSVAWTSEKSHPLAGPLLKMIDNSPNGSLIRIHMYAFSNQNYANALLRAIDRGVKVRIILSNAGNIANARRGSSRARTIMDEITAAQQATGDEDHWFIVCQKGSDEGACIRDGKNHNKFFMFSHICRNGIKANGKCARSGDGKQNYYEDVVFQTSLNLTYDQLNSYNTGTITFGQRDIYEIYYRYFNRTASLSSKPPNSKFEYLETLPLSNGTQFKFYGLPKPKLDTEQDDVFMTEISKVRCQSTTINGKTYSTVIRVINPHWTNSSRGTWIVKKLENLRKQGCVVYVLGSVSLSDLPNAKYKPTFDMIVKAKLKIKSFVKTDNPYGDLHSKFVVVRDPDQIRNPKSTVMYGSMSFTNPALIRNDETWVVWDQPSQVMLDFYTQSFDAIWRSL